MSERLTKRKNYGCACWNGDQNLVTHRRYSEMLEALAKYEDVIFDADGNEVISLKELAQLLEDKREGRVAVLPCKVGTTVYEAMAVVTWGYPDPHFGIRVVEKQFELSDTNAVGVSIFLTPEEAERRHALAAADAGKETSNAEADDTAARG